MTASWPCSECPKSFGRKGDLTRHSLLHTGYRPHSCPECGKSFAQYSALRTHINVHTGAKPYACGIAPCQATFGDPSSCSRHRKETHRRPGAYRCPESRCKSSIKRRSAFLAHLRKHGKKYAGVDIEIFFSGVAHSSRANMGNIELPILNLPIPPLMTYESQPTYDPFASELFPDTYLDLHAGELLTFDARSPSHSPSSNTPSPASSSSSSPSPSPIDQDEPRLYLPHVNIASANASYEPQTTNSHNQVLSPVSQFMLALGYDASEYSKPTVFG